MPFEDLIDESAQSLADRAYEQIRTMILDLQLLPGQSIVVHQLAEQLGMSRTPVREAVVRLGTSLEGLVSIVPPKNGKSTKGLPCMIVSIPTGESMREIYELVEGVEGEAVKLAVERADEPALQALEAAVIEQEAALVADDLAAWTQADRRFHRLLIEASGNRRLGELIRLFDGQLHRVRVATIHLRTKPIESTCEHREILDAVRARDYEQARRVHGAHRQRALREMVRVVGDYSSLALRAAVTASADARQPREQARG